MKIICICGQKFDIETDKGLWSVPRHSKDGFDTGICRGTLIFGGGDTIDLSFVVPDSLKKEI